MKKDNKNNEPISFVNEFSDRHVMAWKYAKNYKYRCCCPDCDNYAIKSHLLQKHPVLQSLCDKDNKIWQFEDNMLDPRSGDWDLYKLACRGISEAFRWKLFCKEDDSKLFSDLEKKNNSIPVCKRDAILLAYRSACAVRHQEEQRLHCYEYSLKKAGIDSYREKIKVSNLFIQRMNTIVENLWKAIKGEDQQYYLFRLFKMPMIDVAVSDCLCNEDDMIEHLNDLTYCEPFNCLFINIIPGEEFSYLLLGCDSRYDTDNAYEKLIMSIPSDFEQTETTYIQQIQQLLLYCRNWCCSTNLLSDSKWKHFIDYYEEMKISAMI